MSKRPSKQELQQDELVEFSHKLAEWVAANANLILTGFVVIALAIGGVVYARTTAAERVSERASLFDDAFLTYYEGLNNPTPEGRDQKMNEAGQKFREFSEKHSGELANYALYMEGNTWHNRGVDYRNFEKALDIFQEYVAKASKNDEKALGHTAIGYCQESLAFGRRADMEGEKLKAFRSKHAGAALDSYKKAEDLAPKGSWMRSEAMLARARVLNSMGRYDEALKLAETVKQAREYKSPVEPLNKGAGSSPDERQRLALNLEVVKELGLANSADLLAYRIKAVKASSAQAAAAKKAEAAAKAEETKAEEPAKAEAPAKAEEAAPEKAEAPAAESAPDTEEAKADAPASEEAAPAAEEKAPAAETAAPAASE